MAAKSYLCLTALLGFLAFPLSAGADLYDIQEDYLGEAIQDQFGIACSPAGDVNNDGFDDFLVGANVCDEGALSGGKAYLYLGGAAYPTDCALSFAGTLEKGYAGQALASGDLNDDGYSDWVVGAPGTGADGQHAGRVYVFLGGTTPDAEADLVLEGDTAAGQFGYAVCVVDDLDGDGYGDLAVGAPRDGDGRVFIYRGGPLPLDDVADASWDAGAQDGRFGWALASFPDRNGDGCDELLVGSPKNSESAAWAGAVHLFDGSATLDATADLSFFGEAAGDEFGRSLASGHDLDGDGEPDLVVGAPAANAGGLVDSGRAYFYRGGAQLDTIAELVFSGEDAEDRLGSSLATGFDWNGDGEGDLALGIPDDDGAAIDAGAVLIHWGGAALDTTADEEILGSEAGIHLGKSLAAGGDVRSNDRGTLITGGYNEVNTGQALLYGSDDAPVGAPELIPIGRIALDAPWPNPFNPSTSLRFHLPAEAWTRVSVLDARGRRLEILHGGILPAGFHEMTWTAENLASGAYLILVESAGRQTAARAVLLK